MTQDEELDGPTAEHRKSIYDEAAEMEENSLGTMGVDGTREPGEGFGPLEESEPHDALGMGLKETPEVEYSPAQAALEERWRKLESLDRILLVQEEFRATEIDNDLEFMEAIADNPTLRIPENLNPVSIQHHAKATVKYMPLELEKVKDERLKEMRRKRFPSEEHLIFVGLLGLAVGVLLGAFFPG